MRLILGAELSPIKAGLQARCPSVGLAGHGRDAREAIDSLQRGILAWCRGLEAVSLLDSVLADRGLQAEESRGESIMVDITVAH